MRVVLIALIAGILPIGAYATGSFNGASSNPTTRFTADIEATTFDGAIWVTHEGQRVQVAIGTPQDMKRHGLPLSDLQIGKTVTIDAYMPPAGAGTTLYARRLVIDGRIVDMR